MVWMLKMVSNFFLLFYFDVRDVCQPANDISLSLAYLQDLDSGMFLGRGIGHDSYLFSAIYLLSLLSVSHFRFILIYLLVYLYTYLFTYIPHHHRHPEVACF